MNLISKWVEYWKHRHIVTVNGFNELWELKKNKLTIFDYLFYGLFGSTICFMFGKHIYYFVISFLILFFISMGLIEFGVYMDVIQLIIFYSPLAIFGVLEPIIFKD